jgi:hypothetical protein
LPLKTAVTANVGPVPGISDDVGGMTPDRVKRLERYKSYG